MSTDTRPDGGHGRPGAAGADPVSEGTLLWVCSCHTGGVARRHGALESAQLVLERAITAHLGERGNEGHAVQVGCWVGAARLDSAPRPLVWDPAVTR